MAEGGKRRKAAKVEKEHCEYACPVCCADEDSKHGRLFWKKVPVDNPNVECRDCGVMLEPFDDADEIGHGEFECDKCGNTFTNGKAKWDIPQPCYGKGGSEMNRLCQNSVKCWTLGPWPQRSERKSRNKHSCEGCETGECSSHPVSAIADRMKKPLSKSDGKDK